MCGSVAGRVLLLGHLRLLDGVAETLHDRLRGLATLLCEGLVAALGLVH